MASYANIAKKLQNAINQCSGSKLLINTQQWYSEDKGRAVTVYTVRRSTSNKDEPHRQTIELFRTYSHVQLVLWLRDYWYELNGWEIPADNKEWEEVKKSYDAKRS